MTFVIQILNGREHENALTIASADKATENKTAQLKQC
jgi:hypothetical protein